MTPEPPSHAPLWDAEIIGGPEEREVVIVDHQTSWSWHFEAHRRRIEGSLGGVARRIEHVGSTAVPGLPAKPIVDVQVSVTDIEHEPEYKRPLEGAGYMLRVREAGHRMFRTPELDVHVHLCEVGSAWERRHLLFRDWLRNSPQDCELYARIKQDLAARKWPTMNHYADAKSEVIASIAARAEAWGRSTGWSVR